MILLEIRTGTCQVVRLLTECVGCKSIFCPNFNNLHTIGMTHFEVRITGS
jgi:hypothetical protein